MISFGKLDCSRLYLLLSRYDDAIQTMMSQWHERSFLIELKPRTDYANLFVDCPPIVELDKYVVYHYG
jgi:hypothetical protein